MKALIIVLFIASHSLCAQSLTPYRIGIFVADAERSTTWYEDHLGFKCYKRMNFPQYDSLKINCLKSDNFEIEIVENTKSFSIHDVLKQYDVNSAPLEGIAKLAFRVDNINETYRLVHHPDVNEIIGVTYDKELNCDFFLIKDPDGNMLQFISPRK